MFKIRQRLRLTIIAIIPLIITGCTTPGDPSTQQGCAQTARQSNRLCSLSCGDFAYNAYKRDLQTQCKSRCSVNENLSLTGCDRLPQAQIQSQPQEQPISEDYQLTVEAAERGDAEAQAKLGYMKVREYNYSEAMKWNKLAAGQGNADAQNELGTMYENGWGVAKDYDEALHWYKLSADQGNAAARLNINTLNQKLNRLR